VTIDYTAAARTYDNTRRPSDALIECFARRVPLDANTDVLEFGCGTANYLHRIRSRYGCRCHGIDPSACMRAVAQAKSAELRIVAGDHAAIPFASGSFAFCYMVDVIHHVPDRPSMFRELFRVLGDGGVLAVATESHAQIEARFYNRYFPSLPANEKRRYPDIGAIVEEAGAAGFRCSGVESVPRAEPAVVSDSFIRTVSEQNYSMFRLLAEAEFAAGLKALRADLGRCFERGAAGETVVWFDKRKAVASL
jgi:SAM-dependent methyltransferase